MSEARTRPSSRSAAVRELERRHGRTPQGALTKLLVAVALLAWACGSDPSTLVGYRVEPAPKVGGFTLTDLAHDDAPFELRAPPGDLLLVYLGFTNCPDACPTAMSELRAATDRLRDRADRI